MPVSVRDGLLARTDDHRGACKLSDRRARNPDSRGQSLPRVHGRSRRRSGEHHITNSDLSCLKRVRITGGVDREFCVTSNFATYRSKRGRTELYFGHHRYVLTLANGDIRIRQKTSFLDSDDIAEQGKVSIII